MGILLVLLARILQVILSPIFVIWAIFSLRDYKKLDKYFGNIAFGRDQLGNAIGGPMMNDLLLKKNPIKLYGNVDETISHVTGKNYVKQRMTWLGKLIARILNNAEAQHVQMAAEAEQDNTQKDV